MDNKNGQRRTAKVTFTIKNKSIPYKAGDHSPALLFV